MCKFFTFKWYLSIGRLWCFIFGYISKVIDYLVMISIWMGAVNAVFVQQKKKKSPLYSCHIMCFCLWIKSKDGCQFTIIHVMLKTKIITIYSFIYYCFINREKKWISMRSIEWRKKKNLCERLSLDAICVVVYAKRVDRFQWSTKHINGIVCILILYIFRFLLSISTQYERTR